MARASESIFIGDFDKLIKALKQLDPQLRKDFNKALNAAAKPLVVKAKTFIPGQILNNSGVAIFRSEPPTYTSPSWINDKVHRSRDPMRWVWQPAIVARGIKIKRTTRNKVPYGYNKIAVAALAVVNSSPAGAIYELSGRGTDKSRAKTKSVSRNPKAQDDFKDLMTRISPLTGDATKGRILYKAEAVMGDSVRQEVQKVVDERLMKFVRSI